MKVTQAHYHYKYVSELQLLPIYLCISNLKHHISCTDLRFFDKNGHFLFPYSVSAILNSILLFSLQVLFLDFELML